MVYGNRINFSVNSYFNPAVIFNNNFVNRTFPLRRNNLSVLSRLVVIEQLIHRVEASCLKGLFQRKIYYFPQLFLKLSRPFFSEPYGDEPLVPL